MRRTYRLELCTVLLLFVMAAVGGGCSSTGTSPSASNVAPATSIASPSASARVQELGGFDAAMALLRSKTDFKCVRVADRLIAALTEERKDQLEAQATAAGGPGHFLLPDKGAWVAGQMWIGDAAGAAQAYGAELVGLDNGDAWLVGPRDEELIGFELLLLDVRPDLPLWRLGDLILPQPDNECEEPTSR